ncbi:unnamed protein product [Triticum turgidum subsp. durum]|uniref:F-box domain-containing protein n=1 Tax=Triticum turgidum subsp. durum TaxID=4567 RepID=A0A9R0QCR1_TRITD|nr:unnamed protein product [Triticum turgidum subsp. durum]
MRQQRRRCSKEGGSSIISPPARGGKWQRQDEHGAVACGWSKSSSSPCRGRLPPRRRIPQQPLGVWRRNWWMRSSRTRSSRIFHASRSSPNSLQDMSTAAGAGKSRALQKRGSFPLDLLVRRKRSGETRGGGGRRVARRRSRRRGGRVGGKAAEQAAGAWRGDGAGAMGCVACRKKGKGFFVKLRRRQLFPDGRSSSERAFQTELDKNSRPWAGKFFTPWEEEEAVSLAMALGFAGEGMEKWRTGEDSLEKNRRRRTPTTWRRRGDEDPAAELLSVAAGRRHRLLLSFPTSCICRWRFLADHLQRCHFPFFLTAGNYSSPCVHPRCHYSPCHVFAPHGHGLMPFSTSELPNGLGSLVSNSGIPKKRTFQHQPKAALLSLKNRPAVTRGDYHRPRLSLAATKCPPCQEHDNPEVAKDTIQVIELDKFPEDILHHIHSLVPLRDAARAACVSRRFLRSWKCFPNLTFNWKTLGLNMQEGTPYDRAKKIVDRIYHILKNHSGIGVKILKLQVHSCSNVITANLLGIWLETAVKSGIVELAVDLPQDQSAKYDFPCSVLSCAASSIQSLAPSACAFRPTIIIDCFRNLKSLCLKLVLITEEELGCFFSCTISLEKLEVSQCNEITFLKIPSHLQQLCILRVFLCQKLQVVEIYAPKVATFMFCGPPTKISITNPSQLKIMTMDGSFYAGMFHHALTKLHSITSNLHTLVLCSSREVSRHYLRPEPTSQKLDVDSWHIRKIPGFRHDKLKKASITGINSSKSLIELTCQILKNSSSLECLVLDTTSGYGNSGICGNMDREAVMDALEGVKAIKRHVEGQVPDGVNVEVLKPCDRCHISKL